MASLPNPPDSFLSGWVFGLLTGVLTGVSIGVWLPLP